MRLLAQTDGGWRRPDEMFIGVLLTDMDTGKVLVEHGAAVGKGTHNEAEYRAVLWALHQAEECGAEELYIRADSRVVVNQINGRWACRTGNLPGYHAQVKSILSRTGMIFSISWVPRKENQAADALASRAKA